MIKQKDITASLASVQSAEVENKQFIQDRDGKQRETTQQVKQMRLDISCIRHKEEDHTNRINEFADDISEIKGDIEEIRQTIRDKDNEEMASFSRLIESHILLRVSMN